MKKHVEAPCAILQDKPRIYSAVISGKWLLDHSTPSWRLKKPRTGFQRIVREDRAIQIAVSVLDQGRTFPNSIVLATDVPDFNFKDCHLTIPANALFLVVDGQHRLWAQNYAEIDSNYSCIIHMGLTVVQMARLFLEINDNQKRVPSSLRWDLVRLVRPEDDPAAIEASELVYQLATSQDSPLFQKIDLTGEQGEIEIKQGSIAPEIKTLVSMRRGFFKDMDYDQHFEALTRFISAVRSVDTQGWREGRSPLAKARILRAILRTLPLISEELKMPPYEITTSSYLEFLKNIDLDSLDSKKIVAVQGSAGIKQIFDQICNQIGL